MKQALHLALAVLCLAGMWLHVDRVLIAHQISESQRQGTPRGNLSDLYPRWIGTRELLLHRRDPYSREVTLEIQAGYYGRAVEATTPHDPTDQQAFAYPLYTVFLLAPTVELPFSFVRVFSFWLFAALTVLSVVLWARFLRWQVEWNVIGVLALLTLASFAVVQGLKLQQLSLLVAFLLAGSLVCLAAYRFVCVGILLALATIKPQLCFLLVGWLLLWAVSEWRKRWVFAASFFFSLGTLVGGAELLSPGWIPRFYEALRAYRQYAPAGPLLEQMLPREIAIAAIFLLAAIVVAICWRGRKCEAKDPSFAYTTSLVLAVTLLLIPMMPPYNQVLLLPGIFLLVRDWREFWARGVAGKVLLATAMVPLAWSWASAIVIAGASFFTTAAQDFWQVPLWTSVVLPIPIVACLGLQTWKTVMLKTDGRRPIPET